LEEFNILLIGLSIKSMGTKILLWCSYSLLHPTR